MLKIITFLSLFFIYKQGFALEYGIDQIQDPAIKKMLTGKRLAVLAHGASVNRKGEHIVDLLHKKFHLKKIFTPEHGLRSLEDSWVENGRDERTGLAVISLYQQHNRAPRVEDLQDIDLLVVDLQDVGLRYYTYFSTLAEVIKVCSKIKLELIILDRPNPLGGLVVEGKTLDKNLSQDFISYHPIPTRHGLTLAELAKLFIAEENILINLKVVSLKNWKREKLDPLERKWIAPSPALPSLKQVHAYALWGALEHLNLALGRGKNNHKAFLVLGAPWISLSEAKILSLTLNTLMPTKLKFTPYSWTVTRAIFEGQKAQGIKLHFISQEIPPSDEVVYKIASVFFRLFSNRLIINERFSRALGSHELEDSIKSNVSWVSIRPLIQKDISEFYRRRKPYLLY